MEINLLLFTQFKLLRNAFCSDASAENKQSLQKLVRVIVFSTSPKYVEASQIHSILHKRNQM